MRIAIITGITGQDGAYLSRLLLGKNYRVIGITRPNDISDFTGLEFLQIKERVYFESIDLLDYDQIEAIINKYQPDEFYNLAAQSSVGVSFKTPQDTIKFNILSVLNILETLRKNSPHTRYYQASSSEMFGNIRPAQLPITGAELFHPASPYGISKAAAHWATVNYREAYGLHTSCGILFNHESCLRKENFVVKKVIKTAIAIKKGAKIQLEIGDTSIQRDWGYAAKYVEAMWLMLQRKEPQDYLICSGNVSSLESLVRQVFHRLELDFDKHVSFDKSLFRNLELNCIYGDNYKAKKDLGWNYDLSNEELIDLLISDEYEFQNFKTNG
ncbi:GDP-mannose 4,6-dehydratase [Reichenbachiella sp. MALMAid0571]|uniref:GDP-mannose 4,6-dehydratase n=1 Tax=Reichenbachiella sp. MALMAid0571 TaxID=3143939 RepID=UPI0032DF19F2